MTEFIVGDTVALKSGGHPMTVHYVQAPPNTGVDTVWIDETGIDHRAPFMAGVLIHIKRQAVGIDEATTRYVWVFAETGEPIADHIAMGTQAD